MTNVTDIARCALAALALASLPAAGAWAAEGQAFRARGQEPGWLLVIDAAGIELTRAYGSERILASGYTLETAGGARTYRAEAGGRPLVVTVEDRLCADTMSGMQHPDTVTVVLGDERLEGCGGEPAALLLGEWLVEALDGGPVAAGSRPTLAFEEGGRVSGHGSCNRFMGSFELTGEGLAFGPIASTRMACAPELMQQESRLLDLLAEVLRFEVKADGRLVLHAGGGRTVGLRRA